MPRVLVVLHSYGGNGAAVMTAAIVRHWLGTLGWRVDLYRWNPDTAIPEELTAAGARIVDRVVPSDYALVVMVTVAMPALLASVARLLARRVPSILWVHEGDAPLWSATLRMSDWLRVFQAFGTVVFQTTWQRDKVFASFLAPRDPASVVVVPNGLPPVDADAILPQRPAAGRRRAVFVGGVYPRKRPQDLALAVELLGRREVECLFIGATANMASCAPDLHRLVAARPEDFRVIGELPRPETLSHIAGADLLCLPSDQESQGLVLLEAAALGAPICASDLPPYAGIWRHGRNCLLHPVGDTDLLAVNLLLLLDRPTVRQRLVAEARRVAQRFVFARFAAEFTATAQAAMDAPRR